MGRNAAVVVVVVTLMTALTGCFSWFPPPPAELVTAAEHYEDQIRALPGVETAEATVQSVDPKDRPGEWRVSLMVDAISAESLSTVPALVDAVAAPSGAELTTTLRFPAGPGQAPAFVSDAQPSDVEHVAVLRELPFAVSAGYYFGLGVELVEGTQLADAVSGVRASGVLTSDPFDRVSLSDADNRVSVELSLAGPSDALLRLIQDLERDSSVEHISSSEPSIDRERPTIVVRSEEAVQAAEALAALVEPSVEGRRYTSFLIFGGGDEIRGFVGLPLGSAEPDDGPVEQQPVPVDPAVVADDLVGLAAFLEATVESSGIPGTAEVFASACTDSVTSSQAQGSLLLPVFEHEHSAERAYEAIVAAWEADGYAQTDQATGTAIYTTTESRVVAQLTIRGTGEGIQIWAFGACRG